MRFYVLIFLIFWAFVAAASGQCVTRPDACPDVCPPQTENVGIFTLASPIIMESQPLRTVFYSYVNGTVPNVLQVFASDMFHMTINYFCCISEETRMKIVKVLEQIRWNKVSVSVSTLGCSVDEDGVTFFGLKPDDASQAKLMNLTRTFESAIENEGVPVKRRTQPFFINLAVVNGTAFPVEDVMGYLAPVSHPMTLTVEYVMLGARAYKAADFNFIYPTYNIQDWLDRNIGWTKRNPLYFN